MTHHHRPITPASVNYRHLLCSRRIHYTYPGAAIRIHIPSRLRLNKTHLPHPIRDDSNICPRHEPTASTHDILLHNDRFSTRKAAIVNHNNLAARLYDERLLVDHWLLIDHRLLLVVRLLLVLLLPVLLLILILLMIMRLPSRSPTPVFIRATKVEGRGEIDRGFDFADADVGAGPGGLGV